ncbi:Hypothetical predicted protein [Olea europaea subsp. europaea]|uniref:Uncharacterized protein n=1 Tax=Olea europaea subsp. europaea TaxID=158383 RepID=A0A8S0SXQ1_OLEEU|nr:Hypothetical predicted protein [Olea europaea subsp. europaea]
MRCTGYQSIAAAVMSFTYSSIGIGIDGLIRRAITVDQYGGHHKSPGVPTMGIGMNYVLPTYASTLHMDGTRCCLHVSTSRAAFMCMKICLRVPASLTWLGYHATFVCLKIYLCPCRGWDASRTWPAHRVLKPA